MNIQHPRSRAYRCEPEAWQIKDCTADEIYRLIIKKAEACKRPPACVFDLDGTLFDVGYRTLGIIQEWLESTHASKFDAEHIKKIAELNYSHIGYSLSHAFENANFDLRDEEILNLFSSVESVWKKKFFDGFSLLKYDLALEGAADFVKKIQAHNIQIFYLTGRHTKTMGEGTLTQLQKHGFPISDALTIILKENVHMDDQLYKAEKIKEIEKKFEIVGNFENEYVNLAHMAQEVTGAIHVIVDTQHSGRPMPLLELPVYRITEF